MLALRIVLTASLLLVDAKNALNFQIGILHLKLLAPIVYVKFKIVVHVKKVNVIIVKEITFFILSLFLGMGTLSKKVEAVCLR